jgi:Flp pilus assembly protein TadG
MSMRSGRLGRCRDRSRGQALTEFALVIPIFVFLIVGLFDIGRAVFSYNTLTNAAREGARIAIVNQDVPTIVARAKEQTAIVELNDPSVSVAFWQVKPDGTADTSDPCNLVANNCLAVVRFEATYRPITPIIGNLLFGNGVTFAATSTLTVEYRCPNKNFPTGADCPKQP